MIDITMPMFSNALNELGPIVGAAIHHGKLTDRLGGYVCLADQAGRLLGERPVGRILELSLDKLDKCVKYARFAPEKCVRLAQNPGHLSSMQSRCEAEEKYGGSIRGTELIYGFSGLPEKWDEACMLALAHRLGDIEFSRVCEIAKASNNEFVHFLFPDDLACMLPGRVATASDGP